MNALMFVIAVMFAWSLDHMINGVTSFFPLGGPPRILS